METKTEADSNVITECPHDDKPTIGVLCFANILIYNILIL